MNQNLYDLMEDNPVIAAVSDMEGLKTCCGIEEIKVVFILFGDICNISSIVGLLRESNKTPIVHIDLVKGIAVDFIKDYVKAEGIISTKPFLIKRARELSLCTVLRIFLLDSMALSNIQRQMDVARPDAIEILPGLMPKAIKRVSSQVKIPLIVGGLISDKEDVMAALASGAFSVSTTNPKVWEL